MENLRTREWDDGAFRSLVGRWFYSLEEEVTGREGFDANDAALLSREVAEVLERRLAEVSRTQPDLCDGPARLPPCPRRRATTRREEGILAWLMGQPHVGADIKRAAGLKGELDDRDASAFLRGLLAMLQQTGRKGLMLVLDEVETLQRMRSDVREKSLNALRQWIDDIDGGRYPGLYLMVTGTPAFFDGNQGVKRLRPARAAPPRGLRRRPALGQHARGADPAAALRRRAAGRGGPQGARPLPRRDPARSVARVGDNFIAALAADVTRGLGGKVGVAPRIFLKKLVAGVLDRVDDFDDFDPAQHFKLTLSPSGADPGGVRGRGRGPQRRRHRARPRAPRGRRPGALVSDGPDAFDRLSPAMRYQIVNSLGFRRPAAGAGALDPRDPRRLQLRDPRADGGRQDGVGVLPRAERDRHRGLGARLGALRGAHPGVAQQPGRPPHPLRRDDRPSRVHVARRHARRTRRRFLKAPADVLLTTPESLEVMLISPKVPARRLFAGLRAVVIDEVHAFVRDDRGGHLAAILERLSRYCGRDVQRIALSATVGNPDEILEWLAGSSTRPGRVVRGPGENAAPRSRSTTWATTRTPRR
jgi:hypothetical protein